VVLPKPDGRTNWPLDELQPEHAAAVTSARWPQPEPQLRRRRASGQARLGGVRRQHLDVRRDPFRACSLQSTSAREDRLGEALARALLLRLSHDRRQPRVRRTQQRRPSCARRPHRAAGLELSDWSAPTTARPSSNTTAASRSPSTAGGNALAGSAHGDNLWLFRSTESSAPSPRPRVGMRSRMPARSSHRRIQAPAQHNAAAGKTISPTTARPATAPSVEAATAAGTLASIPNAKTSAV